MNRHQFMMDLLRPGITIESLIDDIDRKQELTSEDIAQIGDIGEKIVAASVTIQRRI